MAKRNAMRIYAIVSVIVLILAAIVVAAFFTTGKGPENIGATAVYYNKSVPISNATLAILEIPPSGNAGAVDGDISQRVFHILFENDIILNQDTRTILPTVLRANSVKYVIFYNTSYVDYFKDAIKNRTVLTRDIEIYEVGVAGEPAMFASVGNNWYDVEYDNEAKDFFRWISNNATINIFSPAKQKIIFTFAVLSYKTPRNMIVYLNGNITNSYIIPTASYKTVLMELDINAGNNVISLNAGDCDIPRVDGIRDDRCVSLRIKKILVSKVS